MYFVTLLVELQMTAIDPVLPIAKGCFRCADWANPSSRASVEAAPTNYLFVQVESKQLDYAATSNASIQDSDCVHPDVNVDQLELERRNCREPDRPVIANRCFSSSAQ